MPKQPKQSKGSASRAAGRKRRHQDQPSPLETATGIPSQQEHSAATGNGNGESVIDFGHNHNNTSTNFHELPASQLQYSQTLPSLEEGVYDEVGCYIPIKLKEQIWAHEFVDLSTLLKSPRELANFPEQEGDLVVRSGRMKVEAAPSRPLTNIHTWTSAFMVFMSVLLEKNVQLAQELLKYMRDIRFAASKSHGWVTYDEQFRLRKARKPNSSWGTINQDLWAFYISTTMKEQQSMENPQASGFSQASNTFQKNRSPPLNNPLNSFRNQSQSAVSRTCNVYNTKGKRCLFSPCRFKHACAGCGGQHPVYFCSRR